MSNLESIGEVFAGDVLVIGGGIAGLIAANRIKESNPQLQVRIVEKSTTGWAGGKANKGGGILQVVEQDQVEAYQDYHVRNVGLFLNDQELLEKYVKSHGPFMEQLEAWGIECLGLGGTKKYPRLGDFPWSIGAVDFTLMKKLRRQAVKNKIQITDKTQIVELLTTEGTVTGAVGFNIVDGSFKIFPAKAVVIAAGSCGWMTAGMWFCGRGNGIAAAYRAGAQLRNAEYSNFTVLGLRGGQGDLVGCTYATYNDLGEKLDEKYVGSREPDFSAELFLGMEKEVAEGRGPIRYEASEFFYRNDLGMQGILYAFNRPEAEAWWHHQEWLGDVYMTDHSHRPEAIPQFIGEMSCTRVDGDMRTTVPGLWAIGDASYSGSSWAGAVPCPPGRMRGSGLMNAGISAMFCGPSVAAYASGTGGPAADDSQVGAFKDEIYAPMAREKGLNPRDVIYDLQTVISPPRFALNKNADRIDDALGVIDICRAKLADVSPTKDYHMLGLYHDLRQMITCAEIYYNASLLRTESRGYHHREDFPTRDDDNWLKWTIVQEVDGAMQLSTEDVPITGYKYKP